MSNIEIQYREVGKNVWIDKIIYKSDIEETKNKIELYTIDFYKSDNACLKGKIHKRISDGVELENLFCRWDNFSIPWWYLEIRIGHYYSKRHFKKWIKVYKKIQAIILKYERQNKIRENAKIQTMSFEI